jgi:hypothetical protein
MRKVVNSDASRMEAVESLLKKHPRLIVFYNFNYELEMLRELGQELSSTTSASGGSMTTGQEPTQSLLKSDELKLGLPSSTHDGQPPFDCQGHWTKDRGNGERFLTCEEYRSAQDSIGNASRRSLSTGESTSPKTSKLSFAMAEWNGHKHQEIPTTDRWLYAVQYAAGAEGWNCVSTDATVFFSLTYSYKHFHQAHGRIDRLNTPFTDLWYYNLVSKSMIDKAVKRSLNTKRSFNESSMGFKV